MAVINNWDNNSIVSGTGDNDTIYNSGSGVTINSGTGDDSIRNSGDSVIIDIGAI